MKLTMLPLLLLACQVADTGEPASVQAPADSAAGEVAFELVGPNETALVVPVTVNGQGPFPFVLDTGATLTCVDQALADSLGLQDVPGAVGFGAGIGGQGSMRLVSIDSLDIGAASAADLSACAVDLSGMQQVGVDVSGLLGLNFLKSFRVTLDFQRNVLLLQDP